jgi:uncharacterized protein YjdB
MIDPERNGCEAMAKQKINELVHCEFCGEDYSATYRRCPFCNNTGVIDEDAINDDYDTDEEMEDSYRGGRRLPQSSSVQSRRQFFRIFGSIVAIALLATIVLLVLSIVRPLLHMTSSQAAAATSTASETQTNDLSASQVADSATTDDKDIQKSGESSTSENDLSDTQTTGASETDTATSATKATAAQTTGKTAASGTATGLSLNKTDFTLSKAGATCSLTATLTPSGSTGTVTWDSEDPSVATVSSNGKVTAVGKGTATISAMLANGATKSCTVRCTFSGSATKTAAASAATTASASGTSSASYALNNTDFTLRSLTETFQLKVTGYSGTVTWSSSKTSVAKVSSNGTVSAVAKGTCTVTAKLDNGKTLTCTVRVNY